jgi:hypothetical protein
MMQDRSSSQVRAPGADRYPAFQHFKFPIIWRFPIRESWGVSFLATDRSWLGSDSA